MKRKTKELLIVLALGVAAPWMMLCIAETVAKPGGAAAETVQQAQTTAGPEKFLLPVQAGEKLQYMEPDEYITGVVLAEMPAEFEPEALKAQAVVARTYALKRCTTGNKHEQRAVCTDPACCQAYCTPAEFLDSGEKEEMLDKVRTAVEETSGQVLTYNGALIEATYFSCSGGRTEDAQAVWGQEIPYLKATDSPGEESASHFVDTVTFSAQEFSAKLGEALTGAPGTWLGKVTYTDGGGVATVQIGSKTYDGTDVRRLLGLRSTAFVMTAVGNTVTVTTKGYGHRVGMSQYGADAMAVKGSGYAEILAHYYPGTTLQTWQEN